MNQAIAGHGIPLAKGCIKEMTYSLLKEWVKSSGMMTEEGMIPIEKANLIKKLQSYSGAVGATEAMIAEAVDFIEKEIKNEMVQAEEKAEHQLKLI